MPTMRRFKQVDVFTDRAFSGNPVAVILEADGLEADEMQRIATWTNLSETTFVLPPTAPEADYRLRIFTANSEVPFAGHPTIGSAHAVMESGLVQGAEDVVIQECGAGLLPLRVEQGGDGRSIFVECPPAVFRPLADFDIPSIEAALGARPCVDPAPLVVSIGGAVWLIALFGDEATVHGLQPDQEAVLELSGRLKMHGVTVFALSDDTDHQAYVRSFAPAVEVAEDPVCGSGNAAVAAFLHHAELLHITGSRFVSHQGHELRRRGVVQLRVRDGGVIDLGGSCLTCVEGHLSTG